MRCTLVPSDDFLPRRDTPEARLRLRPTLHLVQPQSYPPSASALTHPVQDARLYTVLTHLPDVTHPWNGQHKNRGHHPHKPMAGPHTADSSKPELIMSLRSQYGSLCFRGRFRDSHFSASTPGSLIIPGRSGLSSSGYRTYDRYEKRLFFPFCPIWA